MKLKVLLFPILFFLLQNVHGFLLEGPTNGGKQTTVNSQYLTETEFIQAKNLLKQNTDDLRHDMDKTFALMTSQLKIKFDLLETKLTEVDKRNETNNGCVSMEKYLALEQKLTNVQRENYQIKQKHLILENEVLSLKNKSSKQDIKIEELQKLATIKPLQEFSALQQSVHLITDKIRSLSMNEQARSQDFLALYNISTATGRKLTEMETSTKNLILHLENNQTMTMKNMQKTLDNQLITVQTKVTSLQTQLTNFQTSYNATIYDLNTKEMSMQKQITENNERVALYAWASGKDGNVIQFNHVQLSVGIKNISAFKSTGKFVCEKEGLYLMAATVASSQSSNFCINQGNTHVSCTEIGQHSGSAWYSGTSVTILHLHVNDNISIATSYTVEAGFWTQFTLIKIK